MPKGIAVDNKGRLKDRPAMSDTNLLLTITVTVAAMLCLFLVIQSIVLLRKKQEVRCSKA